MARIEGVATRPLIKLPRNPEGCWGWLGHTDAAGYPKKQVGGQPIRAQRWMWQVLYGAVPEGLVIYTTCGTKTCVNPHHLKCGFQADANRAGNGATLTPADVLAIRQAIDDGVMQVSLSERLGVAPGTINDVYQRRRWRATKKLRKGATPNG